MVPSAFGRVRISVYACATTCGKVVNHSWAVSDPGDDFASDGCVRSRFTRDGRQQRGQQDVRARPEGDADVHRPPAGATIADFELRRSIYPLQSGGQRPGGQPDAVLARSSSAADALEGTGYVRRGGVGPPGLTRGVGLRRASSRLSARPRRQLLGGGGLPRRCDLRPVHRRLPRPAVRTDDQRRRRRRLDLRERGRRDRHGQRPGGAEARPGVPDGVERRRRRRRATSR